MNFLSYQEYCNALDSRPYMFESSHSLNEALRTYPIDSVINGISRSTLPSKLDFTLSKDIYRNIAYFQCSSHSLTHQVVQILENIASRRGYFISHLEYFDNKLIIIKDLTNLDFNDKVFQVNIVFESKYNTAYTNKQRYLYHCTTEAVLEKIKRQGLVPRSKSKITNHPDRTYLALNVQECKNLIIQFIEDSNLYSKEDSEFIKQYKLAKNKFIILKIDTDGLNLQLMEDPNCKDFWGVFGVYTTDSIPLTNIEVIEYEN